MNSYKLSVLIKIPARNLIILDVLFNILINKLLYISIFDFI